MYDIYANSQEVAAFLGVEKDNSRLANHLLQRPSGKKFDPASHPPTTRKELESSTFQIAATQPGTHYQGASLLHHAGFRSLSVSSRFWS
jgi:hypothetical protein